MQDRILGAIAVLVAIAMGIGARDYAAPIAYEPIGPSPGSSPTIVPMNAPSAAMPKLKGSNATPKPWTR